MGIGGLHPDTVGRIGQEAGEFLLDIGLGETAGNKFLYDLGVGNDIHQREERRTEENRAQQPLQPAAAGNIIDCRFGAAEQGCLERRCTRIDHGSPSPTDECIGITGECLPMQVAGIESVLDTRGGGNDYAVGCRLHLHHPAGGGKHGGQALRYLAAATAWEQGDDTLSGQRMVQRTVNG